MKCPKCGYYMDDQMMVCPQCGTSVSDAGTDAQGEETFGASDGGPPKKQHKGLVIGIILLVAAIAVWLGIYYYRNTYICREIHLNKQSIELLVGDSDALNVEFVPETTKNKVLTWESSDENVASVDASGIVTGTGGGECTITATSTNGKTDVCSVLVKSLVDIQKESVASVVDYIRKNNPTDENGVAVAKIADIDDEHSFALGSIGDDLVLVYRDELEVESVDIGVRYTTYVNLESGNLETSEVVQDNQVTISGYPVTTTLRGLISLADYRGGDKVAVDSVVSTLEELELNESLQRQLDSGTKGCYQQFKAFLESHPALGCTMEDFGFTALMQGDEETEGSASSSATVVEEIEEPGTDSSMSVAESAAESMVESSVESAAESMAESMAESSVESAIESTAESAIESMTESAAESVADPVIGEPSASESGAAESVPEEANAAVSGTASAPESGVSGVSGSEASGSDVSDSDVSGSEASGSGVAAVEEPEDLPGTDSSAESLSESILESLIEAVMEELGELGRGASRGTEAVPDSPDFPQSDSDSAFRPLADSPGASDGRPPFGAFIAL